VGWGRGGGGVGGEVDGQQGGAVRVLVGEPG
jgi:hypothetical protein